MESAFGLWNKMQTDMWFILRSSDETGIVLKLPPDSHKIIRFSQGEIISAFMYGSEEEAEAAIGAGERAKFSHDSGKR